MDWTGKIRYSRIRKVDCFSHEHARTAAVAAAALAPSCFGGFSDATAAASVMRPIEREGPRERGRTKRKKTEGWMDGGLDRQTDRGTKSNSSF